MGFVSTIAALISSTSRPLNFCYFYYCAHCVIQQLNSAVECHLNGHLIRLIIDVLLILLNALI